MKNIPCQANLIELVADIPEKLYKFRSITGSDFDRTISILRDSRLFWSAPFSFNDPFDCSPAVDVRGSRDERQIYFTRIAKKHSGAPNRRERRKLIGVAQRRRPAELRKSLADTIESMRNRVSICSFAGNRDSVLMWSHYASCHTGLCLEFATQPDDIGMEIASSWRVQYANERPVINPFKWSPDSLLRDTILVKSREWCYEQEWRAVRRDAPSGLYSFPRQGLVSVTFGVRTSNEHKDAVLKLLAHQNSSCKVFQAKASNANFSLEFSEI